MTAAEALEAVRAAGVRVVAAGVSTEDLTDEGMKPGQIARLLGLTRVEVVSVLQTTGVMKLTTAEIRVRNPGRLKNYRRSPHDLLALHLKRARAAPGAGLGP